MSLDSLGYSNVSRIASGLTSTVWAAERVEGIACCVKQVTVSLGLSPAAKASAKAAAREVRALKALLGSKHVVQLRTVVMVGDSVCIEMERMDLSLADLIASTATPLPTDLVRAIIFQVVEGLNECHSAALVHRDVKPANILVSASSGLVKLCDFGLARRLAGYDGFNVQVGTPAVCTRWYKPVEILLGTVQHAASIDVWSLGCVTAELILLKPLFPGQSDIQMLYEIFSVLGNVDLLIWPEAAQLPDFGKVDFHLTSLSPLSSRISNALALEFVSDCLRMNPSQRPISSELRRAIWFTQHELLAPQVVVALHLFELRRRN